MDTPDDDWFHSNEGTKDMSLSITTKDGMITVYDNEIATLGLDFPGIDIEAELEKFASWVASGKGQPPASHSLKTAIRGWLKHAKPKTVRPMALPKPEVSATLDECIARGLVAPDFQPRGDTLEEQLTSLESMATVGWYRLHPHVTDASALPRTHRRLWDDDEARRESSASVPGTHVDDTEQMDRFMDALATFRRASQPNQSDFVRVGSVVAPAIVGEIEAVA